MYIYTFVLSLAGVPLTGHAGGANWVVTARNVDGTAYAGPAIIPAELHAADAPGVYFFEISALPAKDAIIFIDADALGALGLAASERYLHIRITSDDAGVGQAVWSSNPEDFSAVSTFGLDFRVLMALSAHKNMAIKPLTYDSKGVMLTGQLVAYPTALDTSNDTNPLLTIDQIAVMDGASPPKLQSFKSTE